MTILLIHMNLEASRQSQTMTLILTLLPFIVPDPHSIPAVRARLRQVPPPSQEGPRPNHSHPKTSPLASFGHEIYICVPTTWHVQRDLAKI